jgi:hypothetical protein
MPPPGWAEPHPNANPNNTQPACGSALSVQPLEVSVVGNPEKRNRELADRITRYLNDHCLPLIRASVDSRANGDPEVLLYGFVASDFGKRDAEAKTAALLANTGIGIRDAILVRPQLTSQTRAANSADTAQNNTQSADSLEQASELAQQNAAIQQYQSQNQNGLGTILAPLLGLGFIGGGLGGGSGVFISPGAGGWYPGVTPAFGYGPALGPYYSNPIGPGNYLGGFAPFP